MLIRWFCFQIQIQCFAMVRLEIGLGHFKVIKVPFGALVLTPMLCVLPLVLLIFQRIVLTLQNPVGATLLIIIFLQELLSSELTICLVLTSLRLSFFVMLSQFGFVTAGTLFVVILIKKTYSLQYNVSVFL